jgi:uncharacterized protein (DUF488 family)
MTTPHLTIFTIGHSTHSLDAFVALLKQHGVTALADVRSSPYSRFNPQFNREPLEKSLKDVGIAYVFLGHELGARSDDPSCYEDGQVKYARLARTELFRSGLGRVQKGAESHRIALMCAEKDPLDCHRTLLVGRALIEQGVGVAHILSDGSIENYDQAMTRLLRLTGTPESDMFASREELVARACAAQEEKIAYVDEAARVATGRGSE